MTRFAMIAPPLAGHFKPLAALARELVSRGHQATFIHQRGAETLARAHGAAFAPLACAPLKPHRGISGTVREMARQTAMLCRHAPPLLRELGAEAIIADQLEPAGGLLAEHLGLPLITAACALPMNREPGVPPPYVGWGHDPSQRGRQWNEGGWRIADLLMRPLARTIEAEAKALGLGPRRRLEDCFSTRLQIAQAIPGIDFPRSGLPDNFHYLGPFRHPPQEHFDVGAPSDRPLVFCSLGTLQGGRLKLFRNVAKACSALNLRLIITHCGRLLPEQVAQLPGEPMVYDHVPQEAVLAQVDLVVTHAGFNTVLEALTCGVPMVSIPIAFDQPAVAARIAHAGVGQVVPARRASTRALRAAIANVLSNPSYRANARRMAREIAAAGGVSRAADEVEASLS